MLAILERTSRQQPRLLVVEDLHWADQPTLGHLAKLTTTVAQYPTLLVMTSRVDSDPLDEAWRAETASALLTTIHLGPLPPDDARACPGARRREHDLRRALRRTAVGNPLFLDQLLCHADQSQATAVSSSVQSLVQARIDRLAPMTGPLFRRPLCG